MSLTLKSIFDWERVETLLEPFNKRISFMESFFKDVMSRVCTDSHDVLRSRMEIRSLGIRPACKGVVLAAPVVIFWLVVKSNFISSRSKA